MVEKDMHLGVNQLECEPHSTYQLCVQSQWPNLSESFLSLMEVRAENYERENHREN